MDISTMLDWIFQVGARLGPRVAPVFALLSNKPTTLFQFFKFVAAWIFLSWAIFRLFIRRYCRDRSRLKGAVVITGCDYGFGKHIALQFHKEGPTVFAGCLNAASAEKLRESVRSETRDRMRAVVLDVTKQVDVDRVQREVASCGLPLQALINNAGVSAFGWAEMIPVDRYEFNMKVNYFGTVRVTKSFLPLLRSSKGRLVNMGSIGARMPSAFGSAYLSTKAAMCSYSDCVRQEVHRFGVSVCLIEPGFFATELLANGSSAGADAACGTDREVLNAYPSYAKKMEDTKKPIKLMETLNGGKSGLTYVTDCCIDAVSNRFPLPRYVIGWDAQVINYLLVPFAPAWVVDWAQTLA